MKLNGKVYAYVGVIGSGKSYQANKKVIEARRRGVPVIMSDFSDGIRDTCLRLFGHNEVSMDITSCAYLKWKNTFQRYTIPIGQSACTSPISGRDLLKNIGEGMKEFAGEDVWARWSYNDVLRRFDPLSDEAKACCDVIFGSVRFPAEAKAVIFAATNMKKDVHFIFCDYHSESYQLTNHVSEKFARSFVDIGCYDGQDITELVVKKVEKWG